MNTSTKTPATKNNKSVEMLYKDLVNLKTYVFYVTEEIDFFQKLLTAEIFTPNIPNLYENLQKYLGKIKTYKTEAANCNSILDQHKDDIRELLLNKNKKVEDFYNDEHSTLKTEVINFVNDFNNLKLEIFRFTGNLLEQKSK